MSKNQVGTENVRYLHNARATALAELAADIVHDLSQPLNVIALSTEMTLIRSQRGSLPQADLEEELRKISAQVVRMGKS